MRIDSLPQTNYQIQGPARRKWLEEHAPQHLHHCQELVTHALNLRDPSASRSSLVLGAGACTEVPLAELCRASEEVVLTDFDLAAMQRGRGELSSSMLQRRVRFVQCDLTGGASSNLKREIAHHDWRHLSEQGAKSVFDTAADCLDQCQLPDPPSIHTLRRGDFGLVVSSLVLSQLFSYPLLDLLDTVAQSSPHLLNEQERHRRYQQAAQAFRIRVIDAHLHLMRNLLDQGGVAVLLTDIRGFAFAVYGTDHDATHRHGIPLVPRSFPELVRAAFNVTRYEEWVWIADLPQNERPGRGYEVNGFILQVP
jgi:hypothetical protein